MMMPSPNFQRLIDALLDGDVIAWKWDELLRGFNCDCEGYGEEEKAMPTAGLDCIVHKVVLVENGDARETLFAAGRTDAPFTSFSR
jgi:hypothetical protein